MLLLLPFCYLLFASSTMAQNQQVCDIKKDPEKCDGVKKTKSK